MATRPNESGFTLLELVVVLAIVGVSLALIAPSFTSPERRPAPDLVNFLSDARARAIESGRKVTVYADDRRVWTVPAEDEAFELPEDRSVSVAFPAASPYLDRRRLTVFFADGTSVLARLSVQRPGRYGGTVDLYEITVNPILGDISYAYE